jgi:TonB family protein
MRIEIFQKISLDLRIFLFISFCIHLFLFFIITPFSPDLRVNRFPSLNIEISLLPSSLPVMAQSPLPVRAEVKVTQMSDLPPHPSQMDEEKKINPSTPRPEGQGSLRVEPERRFFTPPSKAGLGAAEWVKDLAVTEMHISSPVDTELVFKGKENPPISLSYFDPKEWQGNPLPRISPPEVPQVAMKSRSLSGEKILLALPKYAENPKPHYPNEARKKGYQGEVVLRVEVLSSGLVGKIEVKSSSGYEALDQSALAAVQQWKFNPARKGENPVPLWVNIPIRFELQ